MYGNEMANIRLVTVVQWKRYTSLCGIWRKPFAHFQLFWKISDNFLLSVDVD